MKDRLILGDGVLGTKLVKQTGWDYISRKKDGIDFRVIDSYKDHLFGYDEIINCIACTNTYDENKEENWNINYKGVVALVDHLIDKDIKFIHISTDYLYAHSKQNASEKDVPVHCGNWYGYTKLLGDAYVQLRLKDYLLIRSTHKEEPFPYEKAWINQVGNFDYIAIETQMIAKMKTVATAFQCFFWDKSVMVSPLALRKHFQISMGNYKKNKKASIDIFPKLPISQANIDLFNSFPDKKKDDVADASLIALYHAQKLEEPPPRPSKRRKKK
jgi:hypothetical protein